MARHRSVRNMSYEDDLSDDVYGRSLDELDYAVSPATEAQFMYARHDHTLSSFIEEQSIKEEDEEMEETSPDMEEDYVKPELSEHEEELLQSGLEYIRDVMGDNCDDDAATAALINHAFDGEKALNSLLNQKTGRKQTSIQSNKPAFQVSPKLDNARNNGALFYGNGSNMMPLKFENLSLQGKTKTPNKDLMPNRGITPNRDLTPNRDATPNRGVRPRNTQFPMPSEDTTFAQKALKGKPPVQVNDPVQNRPVPTKPKETFDVKSEYKKRQDGLELLNLVVVGHVDAGKSTLMGHLLFKLGRVPRKVMHKNESESKKAGKGSFAFAWVLDETEEERTRGITMDVAMTTFETKTKSITLMDAPGHRDFIPNMIQGTAQADVAILVVDSGRGEFEAGFEAGGQTREHALLSRSLGVSQLAVAVNKLDTVNWSKERFNEITGKLKVFLKQAGFKDSDVTYIPCSGLTGENLTERATDPLLTAWYKGCCLTEQLDNFKPPVRPVEKPFRMCVSDVYKGQGSAFVVAGKVESGFIQNANKVLLMPAGEPGTVKTLLIREEPVKFAVAGDQITMAVTGVDMAHVYVGSILCDPIIPIKATQRIVARVVVFNSDMPIVKGFMVVLHCQNLSEPATVSKLISILHKTTGEITQRKPRCLPKQSNAVVEVQTSKPICVELYKDNRVLGRIMLRSGGKTIAAGVITEIK